MARPNLTRTDPRHRELFDPVQIGPVTAPNRFWAAPHATGHGWSQPNGSIALRAMKAEGGWGVISAQMTEIASDSDMANHPMDRLWDDGDVAQHAAGVDAIHAHGALAAVELAHGGMRARNITTGRSVIGPSALPVLRPEVPVQARAMDVSDIAAFREAHKAAARRALQAGYDVLYVYAAHDLSLLNHFLSARTNRRIDSYGGSFQNRLRLLREVLTDTLEIAEGRAGVALRFSVEEPGKPGGLRHDGEGRDVVEALAEMPDVWDVNLSGWPADSQTSRFSEEGYQLPFTDFVKSVTSKPVIGVGRFTSPDAMVSLIGKGRLDLIGAARPSIADPFLPTKIREGRVEDIRECIGCNICVSMDAYGLPLRCTQNPTIAQEWQRSWHPERIERSEGSALIVGAGPAGLEAALTLARSGWQVTLADKSAEAGGRALRESRLPGLSAWKRVVDYRLYQFQQKGNVDLYLSSEMSANDVEAFEAEHILIATGADWRSDGVGASEFDPVDFQGRAVLTPDDLMNGADASGRDWIVYDDDHFYMASLLAEKLAADGLCVTYATPLPTIATWTDLTLEQGAIIARLTELGVTLQVNSALGRDGMFRNTLSGAVMQPNGEGIVMVGARQPQDDLYESLASKLSGRVRRIGDCLNPGILQAAILSGHQGARDLIDPNAQALRERPMLIRPDVATPKQRAI